MAVDDKEYRSWIGELKKRYRTTQIKAAVAANSALIEYYWNLGKDISEKYPGRVRDAEFYKRLSIDLKSAITDATGLSVTNIKYARYFFELYSGERYRQQLADDKELTAYRPQVVDDKMDSHPVGQSIGDCLPQLVSDLVRVPWGHHMLIIDKCKGNRDKALFYVQRTIQHGWSRNVLLNWLTTDLYEREGTGQTNFALTMPSDDCDLAQQLVKDPQVFEVFGLKEQHNETELKAAIVANIERTLLSLGKGVAFLGREYPVEIGGETNARSIIVSLRSSILKSSGCQWASPTMSSRRSFRLKPSSRSVTPTPRRNSPQLRLRRRRGGWRNDGLSLQRAVFVRDIAVGTTMPSINTSLMGDVPVEYPDLPTQRRIAAVLGALDDKIEVNRKICENLEAQAQALFKAWFVDAVSPMMPLSGVCKSITDGVHNTVSDVPRTDWRLLSCKNLRNGEIDFEQGYRTISNETFNTLRARTHLDRGDVLVGSVGTIGEIALVCEEPTNYEFQRSVAILKPDLDVISSAYLYCAMRAAKERLMILSHGAVQQCIFLNDFRCFTIQVGSKELIGQFSNIVTPLLTKKHKLICESRALAAMRDALLPKLMSGELVVEKVA